LSAAGPRKRHLVVGLLGLVSVITFLDRLAIAVTGPTIQKALHIRAEQWGWVLSAYVVANGLFEIPSGAMGDRNGQRRELTRIAVWWSVFTAATAWCRNFVQLAGVRFLFGIGAAGAYPNASGVLWNWLPRRERARGQSVIWAASRLGGALAPLLLVPLQLRFGWQAVFWALGGLGVLWAAAWRLWFHDHPADQPGITAEELAEIGVAPGAKPAHAGAPWGELLRLKPLWMLTLAYGCYGWASWFYFNWFPTWMVKGAGFSQGEMGVYASLPFLLGLVSNLVGGVLCDRMAARIGMRAACRWITGGCLGLTACLLLAMSVAHAKPLVVAFASLSFAVMDLMLPAAWAMCMSIGGRWGGTATGVMNTAGQAGGLLCTLLFGYVVAATGDYELPLRMVAVMVVVAAVLFSRTDCTAGWSEPPVHAPEPDLAAI
jgi:MFS transporter, ACS family, glucarate transporter